MRPLGKHRPKPLRVNKRTAFLYAINNSPLTERVNKPEEARLRTLTKCEADAKSFREKDHEHPLAHARGPSRWYGPRPVRAGI